MGRRMTGDDLDRIEKIIRAFKGKPTWGAIYERCQKARLPFAQVTLTRNKDVIAMYKDQIVRFESRKVKAVKGIPRLENKSSRHIEALEARVAELEEQLKQRDLAIERFAGNALKLGVPRTALDRPLAVRRGNS